VKSDDFYVADLRYILPGVEQYGYYAGPESAVLGLVPFYVRLLH